MLACDSMNCQEILAYLRSKSDPKNVEGMARYGIRSKNTLGVPVPVLRDLAKKHKRQHVLALELWDTEVHEARMLAGFIDDPKQVTERQMEAWVKVFDSWDICDQVCSNLFDRTPYAYPKAFEWSKRKEEFVKRAGFVLMAALAVHDKKADDAKFLEFLPVIKREATDERNFVRKATNWALRQIGKRSRMLNKAAMETAREIAKMDSKAARWVAADAIKELESEKTVKRIKR